MQELLKSVEDTAVRHHTLLLTVNEDIEVVECTDELVATVEVIGDHVFEMTLDFGPLRQVTRECDMSIVIRATTLRQHCGAT